MPESWTRPASPRVWRERAVGALLVLGPLLALAHCQAYDRSEYAALTHPNGAGTDADVEADAPTLADACSPAPIEPCSFLSRVDVLPAVDGVEDDCAIGARTFIAADGVAASLDAVPDAAAPPALAAVVARLRTAWSKDGLYVFAHVTKTPVLVAPAGMNPFLYDAVEVFASGTSNVTGAYGGVPGSDLGAVHVIITPPGEGQAGSAALFQSGGNKVADLLPTQFATALVGDGFNVEITLDWGTLGRPAAPPVGTVVAFDFGLDLRSTDGQRFQSFLATRSYQLPPGNECNLQPAPYCDDRLWCTPTLN